jgi:hypothetical protein
MISEADRMYEEIVVDQFALQCHPHRGFSEVFKAKLLNPETVSTVFVQTKAVPCSSTSDRKTTAQSDFSDR